MEQILLNLWATEVPKDAYSFFIKNDMLSCLTGEEGFTWKEFLPPGNYEMLFTTSKFDDNQAADIVDVKEANGYPIGYKDYENADESYREAVHSLESLLRVNGLDLNKNYLLLRNRPHLISKQLT